MTGRENFAKAGGLRVLLVGGPPNVGFVSLAEYLIDHGHDVTVVLEEFYDGTESLGTGQWADLWSSGGITVRHTQVRGRFTRLAMRAFDVLAGLGLLLGLKRQSRRTQHVFSSGLALVSVAAWTSRQVRKRVPANDVIHVRDGGPARRVAAALDLLGYRQPLIISFLGIDLLAFHTAMRRDRYAATFHRSTAVTVATEFMEQSLLEANAPKAKVHVIPTPFDPRRCPTRVRRVAEDAVVRLVSVGRLIDWKGFRYSVLAVRHLLERGHTVHLSILGSGPQRAELESLVSDERVGAHVDFYGRVTQDRAYEVMALTDFLIHPALTIDGSAEAMGLVSLEAQEIGLHVITTDSGGLAETVVPGVSGVIVPQRSAISIADAVEGLLSESDEELEKRIARGRDHVRDNFSITSLGPRFIDLYMSTERRHTE